MKTLFYKIIQNILSLYKGNNFVWQCVMVILTYALVTTHFDWYYFQKFSVHSFGNIYIFPALIGGFFLPILIPFILLAFKKFNTAYAIGQAALLGVSVSSFYKVFTGRIPPSIGQTLKDISDGFQFGIYRGGTFNGWPSSHTTVAFAMALCLVVLYPKKNVNHILIRVLAILYALYIGLAVSVSIHWFSEFIAGAILGSLIGLNVGKSFHSRAQFAK